MRKCRTRQHIIEDLGFNHVERHILLAGYTVNRFTYNDYGYDGLITTFNENGEIENFHIAFQLKSTDIIHYSKTKKAFVFDLSKRDLELWLYNTNPVLLILFDAQKEMSYFIDLQAYFKKNRVSLKNVRKFVRVYIPENAFFKAGVLEEIRNTLK